jgi:hypothetical protein
MTEPWLTMAVIVTCDVCASEFFPEPPGKCSEVGFDYPGDPHLALVHPACAADFVASEFDIVPDPAGKRGPQLYCPHL